MLLVVPVESENTVANAAVLQHLISPAEAGMGGLLLSNRRILESGIEAKVGGLNGICGQ